MFLYVPPCPTQYIFHTHAMTRYSLFVLKVSLNNNRTKIYWNNHVDYITKLATQTLNFIRRNFSTCPFHIREHCYTTLVRPQLEYTFSVWDNNIQCNSNRLESVQWCGARFVCRDYRQTPSMTSMLQRLSWDSTAAACSQQSLDALPHTQQSGRNTA